MTDDSDSAFHHRADALLLRLSAAAEDQLADEAEVELTAGVLQIDFADRTYLINKHQPTRQIWLSSPISGAWHFACQPDSGRWIDTRRGLDLLPLLTEEWAALSGMKVVLEC